MSILTTFSTTISTAVSTPIAASMATISTEVSTTVRDPISNSKRSAAFSLSGDQFSSIVYVALTLILMTAVRTVIFAV